MGAFQTWSAFSLPVAVVALSALSWSQSPTTSLRGTIVDPKAAVVSGAELTLVNPGTGFSRTVTTNTQGTYQFLEIPPNSYSLTIKAPGFATVRLEEVRLWVNTPTTIDEGLKVQGGTTVVEVRDAPALVNSLDATQGHAFSATQIESLPFEGRDPAAILSLQPGVVFTGNNDNINADVDSRSGAVSGARSDQTNLTIDGIDNNDQVRGYSFQGALRPTLDSVQEFRVTTSNANADAGRSSGAQVNLVTKSGTNAFHSSLYEYNRSSLGEANDWFIKQTELSTGQPNVPVHLIRNTFGISAGGPIKKNRFFFFANYEGQRTRENSVVTRTVPSATFRQGILSYQCDPGASGCSSSGVFTLSRSDLASLDPNCSTPVAGFPAGTCPLGPGANPALLPLLQSDPLPNSNLSGDGLNRGGFIFSAPAPAKLDTYIVKLDYSLTGNGNHQLFLRGNLQNDRATGAGPQFPGDPPIEIYIDNNKGIAAGYLAVLRRNLINDFRYGLIRQGFFNIGISGTQHVFIAVDLPQIFSSSGNDIIPVHNWVDNLSWTKGRHALQFGTNFRRISDDRSNTQSVGFAAANVSWLNNAAIAGAGSSLDPGASQFSNLGFPAVATRFRMSYDGAVASLTGILPMVGAVYNQTKTLSVLPPGSYVSRRFRATEAEWYGQDSWRATPSLTLTFGVRYSLLQPPYETTGTQVAPSFSLNDFFRNRAQGMLQGRSVTPLISFGLAGQANGKAPYWDWDYGNVAPRFAFAWSPRAATGLWKRLWGGTGKSSIRGGYGMYYDHFGEGVVNSFDRNGSFGLTTQSYNPPGILGVDDSPRFSSISAIPGFAAGGCPSPPCPLHGPASQGPFPVTPPSTLANFGFAITWGLDDKLKTPYSHVVDFSITRELPHNFVFEATYVGRFAHRLLQEEDLAQPLDIRDPRSGTDYFAAATMFTKAAEAQVPIQNMAPMPYWENVFPTAAGAGKLPPSSQCAPGVRPTSPTATQNMYDMYSCWVHNETNALFQADALCVPACSTLAGVTAPFQFFDPQYASLYAWRSIGDSSYNSAQFSLRRHAGGLETDVNYTFSKSIDLGSNAERINSFEGDGLSGQISNAWSPKQLRSVSDFDTRHQINANWVYGLPFGRGKRFGSSSCGIANALLSGWSVSGLFRWTSGFPATVQAGNNWSTNYDLTSSAVQIGPTGPTGAFLVNGNNPNLFQNPGAASQAFRFAYPGESGQRNNLRGPGYFGIDTGLSKSWRVTESQSVKFSWETFNVTNTPRFDVGSLQAFGNLGGGNLIFSNTGFGNFTSTLTKPRIMQFAVRYSF